MILQCKVHCWALQEEEAETLNIQDPGTWMKFAFNVSELKAMKHATDDITDPLYYCTTIYTKGGDSFTIDVPYDSVLEYWTSNTGIPTQKHEQKELDF